MMYGSMDASFCSRASAESKAPRALVRNSSGAWTKVTPSPLKNSSSASSGSFCPPLVCTSLGATTDTAAAQWPSRKAT